MSLTIFKFILQQCSTKAAQTALRHEKGLRQHLEAKRYTEQSELNNSTKTVH